MTTQPVLDEQIGVYLELGQKRIFACAQAWPGWCRSGKTEEHALAMLATYAERYAPVAREAQIPFPTIRPGIFLIEERLSGSVGVTDFGVPSVTMAGDREPQTAHTLARDAALVNAAWVVFDRIVAVTPAALRKGPRGGGRDRDKMVDHVLGAEANYARKLGLKYAQPARDDAPAIAALRAGILAALQDPSQPTSWQPRYAARRIAWHVLDHAWEMEDRAVSSP